MTTKKRISILFIWLFCPSLSQAETIQCYVPKEYVYTEGKGYEPVDFVDAFTIESQSDHILVTMAFDGATEQLYPYRIRAEWLNQKDTDGVFTNIDSFTNQASYGSRLGFAPEKGKVVIVSDLYNQFHYLWGEDSKVTTVKMNGKEVEVYVFAYYFPTVEGYRVVGDSYYCPNSKIQKMFFEFAVSGNLTVY